nr:pentapeptide repeat-containing protein [Pseudoruegeria sp. HB172150]
MSGLDPRNDFKFSDLRRLNLCGADLRGFDFTGSDLRQCVRNGNTLIDDTTVFDDALVEWIDVETLPIVMKMQEVEAASGPEPRQKLLTELVAEFGKTSHVVSYMVSAASKAQTLDEFLDFALFLPEKVTTNQSATLRSAGLKLLKKKLSQSRSRTGRGATAIFAIENIVAKLQQAPDSMAERIYGHLADVVNSKQPATIGNRLVSVEARDVEHAFSRIGQ